MDNTFTPEETDIKGFIPETISDNLPILAKIEADKKKAENRKKKTSAKITERQILMLGQFFNEVIICFDGDDSGYKAAVRAAENSIKELQPEKNISFLFLPKGEDPDSYVNKNGKDIFLSDRKSVV